MLRILIVDDHTLVREALRSVLEQQGEITVAGQAANGESALILCRELEPDLVLMDIALPDMRGTEVTQRLIAEFPALRVLAVSSYIDKQNVELMIEAGAMGYIHKGASGIELLEGIRAVMSGTPYFSENVSAILSKAKQGSMETGAGGKLGKRETEVLRLIAMGKTSAEIAEILHIATGTVEVHRHNVMNKLDLRGIVELTKYAIRSGLMPP